MNTTAMAPSKPSFYAPVPATPPEDLLKDYLAFLARRNGEMAADGTFSTREAWLNQAAAQAAEHPHPMDQALFEARYADTRFPKPLPPEHMALMAFVRMNAGEAYGVEVVGRARQKTWAERTDAFTQVEKLLSNEEKYHTRILVGAAQHFGVKAQGAWHPPLLLRVLIGTLAHVPQGLFHPVLLASELAGVFMFNWTLRQVGRVFADAPAVRDAMEARLTEILVDEVGHVAFNRLAVGPTGLRAGGTMAAHVARGTCEMTREVTAMGLTPSVIAEEFPAFDFLSLPDEVRRRSFFC